MTQSRLINIRVSENQYNLVINRMENLGYRNMSQFIRDCMLRDDLSSLKMLKEIYNKIIVENEENNSDEEEIGS